MRYLKRLWAWFDDITGVSKALGPPLMHPVPPAKKSRWFYVLGSATLAAFLVQVVTGIALSSSYVTGAGQAYDSLRFITDAPLGRILRGMHYYGSTAMIILIGLHAIRVYLMAAYKYPRQVSWLSGVVLLLGTLLMAFTGQILRWDQGGFWTAVVAAEQAGRTPLIGDWLGHFILAGATPGGATLSRFFAAHVFFIPAVLFAFIAVHLYLVVRNGISEPPKAGQPVDPRTYKRWYHALMRREGVPFWPDAAWRDLFFGCIVVVAIFLFAVIAGPPEIGKPPDPTIIQASPRPDWYFLWYFALLSLIPNWSERFVIVAVPAIFVLFLIALPLVAPKGERSPLRRPWSIVLVLFMVSAIGYYWHKGIQAPWSPHMDAPRLPESVVGVSSGPIADGAKVYYDKGCEFCHRISGFGGIRGPDLSDSGDRMTRAEMVTRLYSGAANMPSYANNLTPQELNVLLDFLQSRHRAYKYKISPPPIAEAQPAR